MKVVLFVPINVTLEELELSKDFVETHVAVINPESETQFISVNGVR